MVAALMILTTRAAAASRGARRVHGALPRPRMGQLAPVAAFVALAATPAWAQQGAERDQGARRPPVLLWVADCPGATEAAPDAGADEPPTDAAPATTVASTQTTPDHASPADAWAVLTLLRVELAPNPVALARHLPTPDARAGLWLWQCAGDHARIAIVRRGARRAERQVELVDVAPAMRARTLALALVVIRRSERQGGRAREPAPSTGPTPATSPRPRATPAPVALHGGAVLRNATRAWTWLLGPELAVDLGRLRAGVLGLGHRSDHALGELSLLGVTALVAWQLWGTRGPTGFGLRLRGELGATWGLSDPQPDKLGRDQLALQANALLRAFGRLTLAGHLRLELALEAGFARGLIAHAGSHEAATTHGPLVGLALALSHRL